MDEPSTRHTAMRTNGRLKGGYIVTIEKPGEWGWVAINTREEVVGPGRVITFLIYMQEQYKRDHFRAINHDDVVRERYSMIYFF